MNAILPIAVHIILKKNDKIFLLKRKNTGFKDSQWSLPAGRVEKKESLIQAAIRETKEETGVKIGAKDLSEPLIMHYCDKRGERIYAFFICNSWIGEPKNVEPGKCSQAAWFNIKNLPPKTIKHVKKAIKTIEKGKKYIEFGF